MENKRSGSISIEELERLTKQTQDAKHQEERAALGRITTKGNIKKVGSRNKAGKFSLPVLNINDPTMWPATPSHIPRPNFTDEVAYNTCLGNCCGVEGLKAGCCQMDPDDLEHVLGPIDEEWITHILTWFKKHRVNMKRADVVIDYEEGKLIGEKFFSNAREAVRAVFSRPESYPILRFQVMGPRFACKFLNQDTGKCTIYEQRPNMCRGYLCQFIKSKFNIKVDPVNHPHTYRKIR